jgi:hypothetical protein
MKKLLVGSLASVLASAGLAVAQPPAVRQLPLPEPAADAPKGDLVVPLTPDPAAVKSCLAPHFPDVVEPCGPWYVDFEYLLWWSKKGPLDTTLVTTGSLGDTIPGAVGQPNTINLLGNGNPFDYEGASGARITLGYWLDRQGSLALEGRGLILEQRSSRFHFASNGSGSPLLGTPFFNTALNRVDFNDIAIPLVSTGFVDVSSTSQVYGGEGNLVANLYRDSCWNLDVLGGFRFLGLDENLVVSDATTASPGSTSIFLNTAFPPPAITASTDKFETYNHFYGGQIGARLDYTHNNILLGVGVRVALGVVHEEININGFSSLHVGPVGPVAQTTGGVYAGPFNMGHQSDDTFAVIPEVEAKIGYQFTKHLAAHVGYTFTYWSDVVRPGDQVDPRVNPNQVPTFLEHGLPGGGPFPGRFFSTTDYYIHGLNVGLEIKF